MKPHPAPLAVILTALASPAAAATSQLWGTNGELFDPAGRLMDWSYAGYHAGEDPLPDRSATISIADHGATADDATDDSAAFVAAIAAASAGDVIAVPAGTFILRERIRLPNGVLLRGAGRDLSIIDVPVSLTDVYGNSGLDGGGTSSYSFGSAFIEARGQQSSTTLATITANAARGTHTLAVSSTSGITAGEWIRIEQTDVGGALIDRLHADLQAGGSDNVGDRGMDFHTRVSSVDATSIEIERALPIDIDTDWSPRIRPVAPTIREIGVEHLTIRFPFTSYPGHFNEQGYNAIDFYKVVDSWVRDVRIINADYGVNVRTCTFVTVAGVILETSDDRGVPSGHHGLNNGHGGDNLFVGFDIRTRFQHDLTNEWYAAGVVFTKGRGDNLRMDHHRAAPYATLWAELDTGAGTQPWVSGGSSNRGPHSAAYDTMWNVRGAADMALPADNYGPRMNFIGFQTAATSVTSPYDWWLETIAPSALEPVNIWEAMRARRLTPPANDDGGSSSGGDATKPPPADAAAPSGDPSSESSPEGLVVSDGCGCRTSGRALPWLALVAVGLCRRRRQVRPVAPL